jgi:hypothetical protein
VGSSLPRRLPPLLPRAISPTLSRRRALLLLLSSSFGFGAPSCCRGSSLAHSYASMAAPPVAKKVPLELVDHGDVRVDNYYWLRDDSRSDPDVLAHLRAENDYTAAVMSGQSSTTLPLQLSYRMPPTCSFGAFAYRFDLCSRALDQRRSVLNARWLSLFQALA